MVQENGQSGVARGLKKCDAAILIDRQSNFLNSSLFALCLALSHAFS